MKRLRVFLLPHPLDWMLVHRKVTPSIKITIPIYTPGWREALWELRVLLKNATQCPRQGSNPNRSIRSPGHRASPLVIYIANKLLSPYLRNIIPMREIVAGEAQLRSCDSNRKLTLGPNCILSPEGMVSSLLSSRTELRDSIHSGSMSPSHTIHDWTSIGSRTTWRAAFVKTPSDHSRVSMSICPSSFE